MQRIERILLVDDEADIRTVTKLALEAVGGMTVETCATGAEAAKHARAFEPDLILLDVMMPGMDGPETFQALRENPKTAPIPVIFFTAKTQKADISNLMALGAIGVMAKPFDPMLIADNIRKIWRQSHDDA